MIPQSSQHAVKHDRLARLAPRPLIHLGAQALSALALVLSACSGGEADGEPDFDSPALNPNGNPSNPAQQNPAASNGGSSGSTTPPNNQTGNTPPNNTPEGNPNNTPVSPSSGGTGGASSIPSGQGGASGTPAQGGTGGTPGQGGSTSTPGQGGSAGTPAQGGTGGTPPVTPSAPDIPCPNGAFFCSGFEGATFPTGPRNIIGGSQFDNAFALDTTEVHSGEQSFFLPLTNQAFSYRVMAIPVTAQAFWARMFVRFDTLFGDNDHDSLFAISSGDLTVDNNNETRIEFSEQEGTIVLNRSTDVIGFPIVRPSTLSANTWHCIETRFDGGSGDVEVFADGQAIISDLGQAKYQIQVQTFRIGTLQFHAPRNVWFDDVIIAPNRVNCN